MCWIYFKRHNCGHVVPDANRNTHARCDAVSAALLLYHDQPSWAPLEQPLQLPQSCAAVFPFFRKLSDEERSTVRQDQQWWNNWMVEQMERNGFGFHDRAEMMRRALGSVQPTIQMPLLHLPFPDRFLRQYEALIWYQRRANKASNVTITKCEGGCGRGKDPLCKQNAGAWRKSGIPAKKSIAPRSSMQTTGPATSSAPSLGDPRLPAIETLGLQDTAQLAFVAEPCKEDFMDDHEHYRTQEAELFGVPS